jgi:hypothetical protein
MTANRGKKYGAHKDSTAVSVRQGFVNKFLFATTEVNLTRLLKNVGFEKSDVIGERKIHYSR